MTEQAPNLADAYREHRSLIWGLAYRLTGTTADADDITQETFARVLSRPREDPKRPLRPWLVQVAVNLSRDALRQRKRRGYVGPWLPAPAEVGESVSGPAARYQTLESASTAFLLALERLNPKARAVLLLRDVLDESAEETAEILGISVANVRVIHHRARKALEGYEQERFRADAGPRTRAALERLMTMLMARDQKGLAAMLAEDARFISDGGGDYLAARHPLEGRETISRLLFGTQAKMGAQPGAQFEIRELNGLPALVAKMIPPSPKLAPRMTLQLDVASDGQIRALYLVVAKRKLDAVLKEG